MQFPREVKVRHEEGALQEHRQLVAFGHAADHGPGILEEQLGHLSLFGGEGFDDRVSRLVLRHQVPVMATSTPDERVRSATVRVVVYM